MNKRYVEFHEIKFPVVDLELCGENISVGTEELEDCIFTDDLEYVDEEAKNIDERISYYVPAAAIKNESKIIEKLKEIDSDFFYEEKSDWIIGIGGSDMDGCLLSIFIGTNSEVKKYLLKKVQEDRANDKDRWDFGTESVNEIVNKAVNPVRGVTDYYAYGCYKDYHIDYSAKKLDDLFYEYRLRQNQDSTKEEKSLTWDDIYNAADDCACGEPNLVRK